jgi:hypothetical protein
MKKYIIYSLLTCALVSCKQDFINLAPITSTSTENFYKTSNDMVNALTSVYSSLQGNGAAANEYLFGDVTIEDAGAQSGLCAQGHCDFDAYASKATGSQNAGVIANRYNGGYTAIARANIFLGRIDAIPMDAALKSRMIGEAKFLRGYFYFNLVKVFGGVPIILTELTNPEDAYPYGRETPAAVFAQIQKDMTEASAALPPSYPQADLGRITSGAAKGMLARVLLFQNKFAEAAPILKAIIDNQSPSNYNLLPNYADVFSADKGNNAEILFAVQYSKGAIGVGSNPVAGYTSTNASQPTASIENAYEPGDGRKAITIKTVSGTKFVSKFEEAGTSAGDGNIDFPVLRYSDILLMYAECLNEAGNTTAAIAELNKVRQRAFGNASQNLQNTNAAATTTYVADQVAMRARIAHERRVEFAFEGLRFFDLVRTNTLVAVMNAYFTSISNPLRITNDNKLFPIPQREIDVNPTKITQNPGYN